jgi:hypothetical protein
MGPTTRAAGHTHAGSTGFSNFGFKNSVNPTPQAPTSLISSPDPALYAFMVHRLAQAIRRADADLAPAVAGWRHTELLGVTQNRSLEAHLDDTTAVASVQMISSGCVATMVRTMGLLRLAVLLSDGCIRG